MLRVAHYRAWIYVINVLLIILQLILIQLICLISVNPRLQLFPVEEAYALILFLFVSIALQLLVSICGILGVYFSNEHVISLTWLLQIPMVIFDVIQAVLWAIAFANLHQEYEKTLTSAVQHVVASNMHTSYGHVCHYWKNLQTELLCCAPATVAMSCQDLTCPKEGIMCHYALLQWLHTNTDLLASVIYFVLFPLKLIILVMLREDISELLAEILHLHNRQVYRHWLTDPQENDSNACDSQVNSKLSSPSDYETVLIPRSRNGSVVQL